MATRNNAGRAIFDDDPTELPPRGRLMSVAQAATYLGVSERWLYDQVRDGQLPAMYIARAWRIRPQVLDAFADTFLVTRAAPEARGRGQARALDAQCSAR